MKGRSRKGDRSAPGGSTPLANANEYGEHGPFQAAQPEPLLTRAVPVSSDISRYRPRTAQHDLLAGRDGGGAGDPLSDGVRRAGVRVGALGRIASFYVGDYFPDSTPQELATPALPAQAPPRRGRSAARAEALVLRL